MLILLIIAIIFSPARGLLFRVAESVPPGHIVGYVYDHPLLTSEPKLFIIYPDQEAEKVIHIDERSGEITTISRLNYEKHRSFRILAVPVDGGDGVEVQIDIEDENDHSPTFADEKITIEISEYARIGAEFPLPLAEDRDGPQYNVQKYRITQGNVNNVFKISTRRLNEVLQAALVVNGQLDREYRDKYDLVIEALDGGKPERIGRLRVQIQILDANDNSPIFDKPRYSVTVSPSLAIGSQVITVTATDSDVGENSRISYKLQKTRENSQALFSISPSGLINTSAHLQPGTVHDLVVVAADHGHPSLETTAFVTVTVQGSSLEDPALDIIWLTETATAHLLENITLGSIVARISLNQAQRQSSLKLTGCPSLCLQQSDSAHIYLILVCGIFDRETSAEYHLKFALFKEEHITLEHPVLLSIGDVNDNAPIWPQANMHISLNRTDNYHPPLFKAIDLDQGRNGRIRYSILGTDLLSIDPDTGRLIVTNELDCSSGNAMNFVVKAEDNGRPPLSSEMQVSADIIDVFGRPPQFEKPLYEVTVKEDVEKGACLLKVKADNSICGGNSRIRYAFKDNLKPKLFSIDSTSGTICLDDVLNFELAKSHQFSVTATDPNGLVNSCLVSVRVLDVNDNVPVFTPLEYNISLREKELPTYPLLVVSATDNDSGTNGEIFYFLPSQNAPFRVDERTGQLYATRPLARGRHEVVVSARDGSGASAEHTAKIHVHVLPRESSSPAFTQSKYEIFTTEDILPGIALGAVQATGEGRIKYSIYSGNPHGLFSMNPANGRITVARYLDADVQDTVLLNVQAELENGGSNHTQVVIHIEDHNDNPPVFPSDLIEISIREDQPVNEAFYIVKATDKDKKKNGEITYSLLSSLPSCPLIIQSATGQMMLTEQLDFEEVKDYRIRVKATDHGIPPKSANITLLLHVTDMNDNAPKFKEDEYKVWVEENLPAMTPLTKVSATDLDTGDNARIHYRITNGSENFSVDEETGQLYTTRELDRELKSIYTVTVTAEDRGKPPLSSSVKVTVIVTDVNDNAPSCGSVQSVVVPADANTNAPFGSIVITDPDEGENGTVIYRSQQPHPLFNLNANGDLFLRRQLSDQDARDFRLSIIVSDQGTPKKSVVCHIPIKVTVGTSRVALVEPFARTVRLPANCSLNCKLIKINATGVAKWQIQSSETSSSFKIIAGVLHMLSLPSQLPPWTITIILSDSEGRQKLVNMKVLPAVSKNLRGSLKLSTTLPIGAKVAVIGESSPSGEWFYTMTNESNIFEIDQTSGSIYLNGPLKKFPKENFHLYFKKVNVTDYETEDIEMEFEISGSVAERPSFKQKTINVEIPEDTPPESVLLTVSSFLTQSPSNLKYRLIGKSDDFLVEENSGDVILKKILDAAESTHHHLLIEASNGAYKTSLLVVILVTDINNHRPEILSSPTVFIGSDSPKIIHHIVARDLDIGPNSEISYEIIFGDSESFKIDEQTGAIYLEKYPENDTKITVRATDHGSPALFNDQELEIRVLNNSKTFYFFRRTELHFNVSSVDDQMNQEFGRIRVAGKEDANLQAVAIPPEIEFLNDKLYLRKHLNPGKYSFVVLATSPQNEIDWATVIVTVLPPNEGPKISSASCGSVTIPENRSYENFKTVVVSGGNDVKFRIQGGSELFAIDQKKGMISCKELDRELKSEHLLVILVEEAGRNDSCTVRVSVSDVNDNSPQFSASTPQIITLDDATKIGDIVAVINALDLDSGENGQILYELLEDPSMIFDLEPSSGRLIYKRSLASSPEFMIRVRARDNGNPAQASDRFIRVKDQRSERSPPSSSPSFLRSKYIADVDEGQERGVRVAKVDTNVRDSRITYSIVEGNVDNAFEIDTEGLIRTSQELDHEIQDHYRLKVIATGAFTSEMATSVDVKVNNLNDNPPSFPSKRNRKLLESVPRSSYITTVTANDADLDETIEYFLGKNQDGFVIDRFTGVIHSTSTFDYEKKPEIDVEVIISDGKHNVSGTVKITLVDVNDNAPKFAKQFYSAQVSPSSQIDDVVMKITATDDDSGENGQISYSTESPFFSISPDGTLTFNTQVANGMEYLITVTAHDHGHPRLSTTVPVRITVSDKEHGEKPRFLKKEYEFLIGEDALPYLAFGNVTASGGHNSYRILDEESAKVFEINGQGSIYCKMPLDREQKELYTFEVEVYSDSMEFHSNSTCTVSIRVTDINDNSPVFKANRVVINLRDGLANGDVLERITATDADVGQNAVLSYRIITGNDYEIFALAPESGTLMFNQWNDDILTVYPNGSWTVIVEAKDHGIPARHSIIPVDIYVPLTSWSATAPFFVQSEYVAHVPETTKPGDEIFKAKAVNRAGIPIAGLSYSLKGNPELFAIDSKSGSIRLRSPLDYEQITNYRTTLTASDARGRAAVIDFVVQVAPVDEFAPVFGADRLKIKVPVDSTVGTVVGKVRAHDADGGPHGKVRYGIDGEYRLLSVNELTGEFTLRRSLKNFRNRTVEHITLLAYSSPMQMSKIVVDVEIGSFPSISNPLAGSSTLVITVLTILAILACLLGLLIFCVCCRKAEIRKIQNPKTEVFTVPRPSKSQTAEPLTSPSFGFRKPAEPQQKSNSMTSSISNNSGLRSALSIREFTSNRSQPDSGIDPDTVSVDSSVTDYLTSIGVNPNPVQPPKPRHRRRDKSDVQMNELIYARVDDIVGPGPLDVSSRIEHYDQPILPPTNHEPTFLPISDILCEISRLQEEEDRQRQRNREYVQIEI